MMDMLQQLIQGVFGPAWPVVWNLLKIVAVVAPLLLGVAYLTYFERKVIAYMHVRIGPNRVGPLGLIHPIADGLKLLVVLGRRIEFRPHRNDDVGVHGVNVAHHLRRIGEAGGIELVRSPGVFRPVKPVLHHIIDR